VALVENLLEFLELDFNGENVTVDGNPVVGMFDKEFAAALDIEGDLPVLICREADVSSAAHGTAVVRSGTSYTVVGMQPDGAGMIALILEQV